MVCCLWQALKLSPTCAQYCASFAIMRQTLLCSHTQCPAATAILPDSRLSAWQATTALPPAPGELNSNCKWGFDRACFHAREHKAGCKTEPKNVSPQIHSNEALCALCCRRLCTCALRLCKPRAAIADELSGLAASACTLGCVADVCLLCSQRGLSCAVFLQGGVAPRQTRHSQAVKPLPHLPV